MVMGCLVLVGAIFFSISTLAFASGEGEKFVQARPLLGTIVTIEVCRSGASGVDLEKLLGRVWHRLEGIHAAMNAYASDSEVSRVNRARGAAVAVSADVYDLVRRSKEFHRVTGKVFDITIVPLLKLWEQGAKVQRYPSVGDVRRVKALVDAQKIALGDGQDIRLPPGMMIDLGGIAPGFAADVAAHILRNGGARDFLVDTGGEIFVSGAGCEGKAWRVGTVTGGGNGVFADVLELKNMAVSTSGDREKFIEIRGERLSRILNPLTGYPVRGAVSITVIAPTVIEADVLSTALCVLGPHKGLKMLSALGPGREAMMLWRGDDGRLDRYASPGYDGYCSSKR